MIEYFIRPMAGIRSAVGRSDHEAFAKVGTMKFRRKAAGVVETAEDIARRIECAEKAAGQGRVGWVHPDCGFWMLKRSVADRKIAALVKGRDIYLGRP
jgi:methionine synthase II (cobalamin-independent)